jgi:hypothetical protein
MGEPADECGGAHVPSFCADCGMPTIRPLGCDRWRCPDCYHRLRSRELRRKLRRLLGRDLERFLEDNPGAPPNAWARQVLHQERLWLRWLHVICSPEDRKDGEVVDVEEFREIRSWANELAKEGGLEGHLGYQHPYAIAEHLKHPLRQHGDVGAAHDLGKGEGGLWKAVRDDVLELGSWEAYAVPSPHQHLLGHTGPDRRVHTGDQVGADEDIWHVVEDKDGSPVELDPDRLKRTIAYLLSHTAVPDESLQRASYAGDLRKNLGGVDTWLSDRAVEVLEQVVDQLLEEETDDEDESCEACGATEQLSIWQALDHIQDRERQDEPIEYEKSLRKAYWYTLDPDDILDPPPEDADPEELAEWIHSDDPVVLTSEIDTEQMPEPQRSEQPLTA